MILIASLPILMQPGCKPAPPAPTAPQGVTRAVVTLLEHKRTPEKKYELKGDTAVRVANCFVGAGQGRKSSFAGGWVAGCTVELFAGDKMISKITLDQSLQFWTEGDGDWELPLASRQAFLTTLSQEFGEVPVR